MRRLVVAAAALCCAVAADMAPLASARAEAGSSARAAADEPGLIGTWRLVRFEDTSADGKVSYPFGEHPFGYFVYDPTGHLSVQVMRNPPIAPFASSPPSEAEVRAANRAYLAYFGTYRVDKAKHVLHHIVEGALNPSYVANPDQARSYRLQGDTLVIEISDPKTGAHQYRELHRVK
jgi:lipocalin-like protein